jgi:O-antigen ligase/tetratricopeptide (TPR) repeat protein
MSGDGILPSMITTIEKALRWVVLGGIFVIPVIPFIVSQSLFFPFITGKNFTFRILVEIISAGWLALALVNPAYRPRRSWILFALAAFVFVIGCADVFGANPFKSIWSNYERMEGWVTLAHLLMLFVVMHSVMNTKALWFWFWHTNLGTALLLCGYGLLQMLGFITINQSATRLDATFGNATYFAVYMLFGVFITTMLAAESWEKRTEGRAWRMSLYGVAIALQAAMLFFTETRGAILGLIGGTLLTAIVMVMVARNSRVVWRASVGTIAVVAVLVGGFLLMKDAAWVRAIKPLDRLASISLSDNTTKARFMNWNMAWQGVKERPILGWGQENYNLVFNKYYDPGMYAQEQWFDRVHNVVFDWLIAGGILGLLAYLSIFVAVAFAVWGSGAFSVAERAIITGLFAGYTFHNLFVFDNITSYLLFIAVLAFIAQRAASEKNATILWRQSVPEKYLPIVIAAAIVGVWGVAWGVNNKALSANRTLITALIPADSITKNIDAFKTALSYQSFGDQEIREQLVQGAARLASSNLDIATKQQVFSLAESEMRKQEVKAPLDARFPYFLGVLYESYGLYDDAAAQLAQASELSPKKQSILLERARVAMVRNDVVAALNLYKEAYELDPGFVGARDQYAAAAILAGHPEVAVPLLQTSVSEGEMPSDSVLLAYAQMKDYRSIETILISRIEKHPDDVQAYFSLAAAYYAGGDKVRAINVLQDVAQKFPGVASQAETLMRDIKNGTVQMGQQ